MLYRQFAVAECARCPDLVLVGIVGGVRYRADRRTVPPADAAVLRRYGIPVLVLDHRLTGFDAEWWEPSEHDLTKPRRYLVAPHSCGSEHTKRATGVPRKESP